MAAAASCGVIVYAVLRGRGGYKRWEIAGLSFLAPEWKQWEVIDNVSFGAVDLVREDGAGGLAVRWERWRVDMTVPFQAQMVRIIGKHLTHMTGRDCKAQTVGEDVPIRVGPHMGRRIEFTFDAPEVRYLASVTLWTCRRTQRVVALGVFHRDGVELERVEKRFLNSIDCHARPVYHKERIRLTVQLPADWKEMIFTGSTKTFASADGSAFLILGAVASSGEKPIAEDARRKLDFFASKQVGLDLDEREAKNTYLRTLEHPGVEAGARALERGRPIGSRVRVWLWICEEDKVEYMALVLAYGEEAVKLIDPVFASLRCHAGESRPLKGWQRVRF